MPLAGVVRLVVVRAAVVLVLAALATPALAQSPQLQGEFGAVSIRSRPANAEVRIDGERWVTPESDAPLVVQLAPGRHTIDIRARDFGPYSTIVDVRRGETIPLNVSLPPAPAAPPAAAAPGSPGSPSSPVVEVARIDDGFAIAPDFRITEVNHETTQFAGFYGGAVLAGQLLIGAGAYWQTNSSTDMWYTGPVVEWRVFADRPVGITAHGLFGYGEADITQAIAFGGRRHGGHFFAREGFFVGEPEVQVIARLTSYMRLHAGVGYRFTSATQDLSGVSGSISLQFGR
jgi:hypothetical protein